MPTATDSRTPDPRAERAAFALAAAAIALLVVACWVPFGWNVGPTLDEWRCLGVIASGHQLVPTVDPGHQMRPLLFLPNALAYRLSPDSFLGLNLVMAVSMFSKGLLLYVLLRQLAPYRSAGMAFLAGALFALYPANGSAFWGTAMAGHFGQTFFLLAVVCFVAWRRSRATGMLLLSWLAIAVPCGLSENVFPFALLVPLLFAVDFWIARRRFLADSALWLVVPLVFMTRYVLVAVSSPRSYQATIFSRPTAGQVVTSTVGAYRFVLAGTWTSLVEMDKGTGEALLCLLLGAVGGGVAFRLWRAASTGSPAPLSERGLLVTGLVTIFIGYVPYLPTFLRDEPSRTMAYCSLGGALLWAVALDALAIRLKSRVLFAGVAAILLGVMLSKALAQHRHFRDWARTEQATLAPIARTLEPGVLGGSTVLIDGVSETLFADAVFQAALRYLLRDGELRVLRCASSGCLPGTAEMVVSGTEGIRSDAPVTVPYDRLILFRADPFGIPRLVRRLPERWHLTAEMASRYRPTARLRAGAGRAERIRTALSPLPIDPEVMAAQALGTTTCPFRWDFDRVVPSGSGWEMSVGGRSQTWSVARRATLNLHLDEKHVHRLRVAIAYALSSETLARLHLEVNGAPVALSRGTPPRANVFTAEIPPTLIGLDPDITELAFVVDRLDAAPAPDRRKLGLLFDWLTIEPVVAAP